MSLCSFLICGGPGCSGVRGANRYMCVILTASKLNRTAQTRHGVQEADPEALGVTGSVW